jgi:hypothetical protein
MAHLWTDRGEGRWSPLTLIDAVYTLAERPPVPLETPSHPTRGPRLIPSRGPEGVTWAVMTKNPDAVLVGGRPLALGVAVLRDRDEIRVEGAGVLFFSTEVLARVEPMPRHDRELRCGRCKLEIATGSSAVCCPGCGVWHHQRDDRLCWTYGDRCSACDRDTQLDAGFRWSPEDL